MHMSTSAQLPNVLFFSQIARGDTQIVGGKSANLGEMVNSGFPVPDGFSTTSHAYERFLEENNLSQFIKDKLSSLDTADTKALVATASQIRSKVRRGRVPEDV